jgi:hypothetical protein
MAPVMISRGGRHISIGVKIVTVALVVFALMSSVTLLTVCMAQTVSRELEALGLGPARPGGAKTIWVCAPWVAFVQTSASCARTM